MSQFTQAWLGLIVDTSIKSIGLAVVAGAALFALRVRDTNLRHRVWTAVMLGMLAMPALVHVTPAIPLPSWLTVAMPDASAEPRPVGDSIDARLVPPPPRQATAVSPDAIPVAESGPDAFSDRLMDERLPPPIAPQPYAASDSPKKETVAAGACRWATERSGRERQMVAASVGQPIPRRRRDLRPEIVDRAVAHASAHRSSVRDRCAGTSPFVKSSEQMGTVPLSARCLDCESCDCWNPLTSTFPPRWDFCARWCCCRRVGGSGANRSCVPPWRMNWPTCGGPIGW